MNNTMTSKLAPPEPIIKYELFIYLTAGKMESINESIQFAIETNNFKLAYPHGKSVLITITAMTDGNNVLQLHDTELIASANSLIHDAANSEIDEYLQHVGRLL